MNSGHVKQAVRLSVNDFSGNEPSVQPKNDVISMEGCEFPSSFTYNSPGMLEGVAFGICLCGKAEIKVNSRLYKINKSTAIVIMPNHIVEPISRSDDFIVKLLVISLDLIADIILNIDTINLLEDNPSFALNYIDKEILVGMIDIVTKQISLETSQDHGRIVANMVETIAMKLKTVLTHIIQKSDTAQISRAGELTQQFLKHVIRDHKKSRSVDHYANILCVSTKYLSQVVRQTTGETPYQWINKIVIIGAKNLIRTKDMSIMQISEEMNFPNPSFFSRFLKQHAGVTPLRFKRDV